MPSGAFFKRVYQLVEQIPPGKVATYRQIATLLGNPRAARTVGWALHSLPEGLTIPWHRVINSQGGISTEGISSYPELQRKLLESENIRFRTDGRLDLEQYQFDFKGE